VKEPARSRKAICFLTLCIPWTSRRKRCNSLSYSLTAQNGGCSVLSTEGFIPYLSCSYDHPLNASDNGGGQQFLQNIGAYVSEYMVSYCRNRVLITWSLIVIVHREIMSIERRFPNCAPRRPGAPRDISNYCVFLSICMYYSPKWLLIR
jgi:hypothetical protein